MTSDEMGRGVKVTRLRKESRRVFEERETEGDL